MVNGVAALSAPPANRPSPVVRSPLPCQVSSQLFFAEQGRDVDLAKALCAGCPIQTSCLLGAIERHEPWGVWGGEVFVDGVIVPHKRGRGRPRKYPVGTPRRARRAA
jgi:WhiB family transcriptional regulator, redox-sensing transcriptional regulator